MLKCIAFSFFFFLHIETKKEAVVKEAKPYWMFSIPWEENSLVSFSPMLAWGLPEQETTGCICCCLRKTYGNNLE